MYLPRTDSSWGRNIIESLSNGVPVIATGKTNILIKSGINGYFLRKYDKNGLVKPSRTDGKRRLYSENDLLRLQIVKLLTDKYGLNLEGAKLVLGLSMRIKEVVNLLEQGVSNQVYKNSAKVASVELRRLFLDLGIKI